MKTEPSHEATLQIEDVALHSWDVVVVGAGPAGAMAARELSLQGRRVLLVDRERFPRSKVCGCCLNAAALGILDSAGLGSLTQRCNAPSVDQFRIASHGREAAIPIHAGVALSRERLDLELIRAAIEDGVQFLDGSLARVGPTQAGMRSVELRHANRPTRVAYPNDLGSSVLSARAKVVLIAAGLGSRVFSDANTDNRQTDRYSRIGAGTQLPHAFADYPTGTIFMACHRYGYVGLVRLEKNQLDVAAAFDAVAVKQKGGIAQLAETILSDAGFPVPEGFSQARWTGTARLTQHRQRVYGDGYFVVGDAAGYVEPFTGEGMAWALASGRAVVPFVLDSLGTSETDAGPRWQVARDRLLGRRSRSCRMLSRSLRYPGLVRIAVQVLARYPSCAQPFVRSLNKPYCA